MREDLRPVARLIAQAIRKSRARSAETEAEDLRRWETKALRALKSGRKPTVAFKSAVIPEHLFGVISGRLGLASTPSEVRAAFKAAQQPNQDYQQQYDHSTAEFAATVAAIVAALVTGKITVAMFRQQMSSAITAAYTTAYTLGASVQDATAAVLSAKDKATITNYIHDEEEYLRSFARDVELGHVPDTAAYLQNRAGMYAEAVHGLYWEGRASRVPAGYVVYYEAEDDKNTCEPCALNEANGPYPIGRAPIPGNDCLGWSRCRCKLRFVPASQQPIPNIAAAASPSILKQAKPSKIPDALRFLKDDPCVIIVRHGTTDLNEADRIRSWQNPPLNAAGKREAKEIAHEMAAVRELRGHGIRRLVSSDLKRAMQTARAIGDELGVEVEPMRELRPWNLGDWNGKPVKGLIDEINRLQTKDRDEKAPGGESFNDFLERLLPALDNLMTDSTKAPKDFTVAVCHTRCQRAAIGWLMEGMDGIKVSNKPLLTEEEIAPGGFLAIADHTSKWEIVEEFPVRKDQDEE